MWRVGLAALLMLLTMDVALAQFWGGSPYGRGGYYRQPPGYSFFGLPLGRRRYRCGAGGRRSRPAASAPRWSGSSREGIVPELDYPVGSIVIDTRAASFPHPVAHRGAALSDLGRPRRLQLDRHRNDQPQGRVAGLASAGGDARARSPPAREDDGRHQEPAGRHGALSRQHALPHPRHQRCQVDRPCGSSAASAC